MSRYLICFSLSCLIGCESLWSGLISPTNSCHNGGENMECEDGYRCDPISRQCLLILPDMPGGTALTLDVVSPGIAPITGGIPMSFMGRNFADGATVTVGGVSAQAMRSAPMEWSGVLPMGSTSFGPIPVTVTNPDGESVTRSDLFAYYATQPFRSSTPVCSSGYGPSAVVQADFNKDGRQDLAIANSSGNTVSVLLGNGTGGFTSVTSFPVDMDPKALLAADLDGDTKLDLAIATASGNVNILLGNGAGSFAAKVGYLADKKPVAIATADFNGDALPDLVVANSLSNDISLLFGTGMGKFSAPTNVLVGQYPGALAVGDA